MNIGFTTYSLPFHWWDNTNIAHNRIFAMAVKAFTAHDHQCIVFSKTPSFQTYSKFMKNAIILREYRNYFDYERAVADLDVLIVFCGPHMPLSRGCLTDHMVRTVAAFKGRAVFVTCDYLLQFPFSVKRFGPVVADLPEDVLLCDKDWLYVLHGGFNHHFKTEISRNKILSVLPSDKFLEVPLNMSGLLPKESFGIPPRESFDVAEHPVVDLLYCGAYRPNRVKTFTKYFCSPQAAKWHISSSQPQKFKDLKNIRATVRTSYGGFIWKFINSSWAQVIFSDAVDNKCSSTPLPTRFWEACSAKVPVFFDDSCRSWASHIFPDMVTPFVGGPEDLASKIQQLKDCPTYRKKIITAQNKLTEGFNPWTHWKMEAWLS